MGDSYVNPIAPVHILSGIAGVCDDRNEFTRIEEEWQAYRDLEYRASFTSIIVYNETTIRIQQRGAENGEVWDEIYLVHDRHGPFNTVKL